MLKLDLFHSTTNTESQTMNPSFMESVWWVCKELFEKGQIYRDYKVMP